MKLFWTLMVMLILLSHGSMIALADQGQGIFELTRLAAQGDPAAMADLGKAYYYGREVLKDPFKAKCWVQRARKAALDQDDDHMVHRAEHLWNTLELWRYSGVCDGQPPSVSGPAAGDRFVEPVTGMAFVWIPGRCFSTASKNKERACPKGFWMGVHEVTQGQWKQIMDYNPSRFKGDDLPVEQVSFDEVNAFIRRMNQASGRALSQARGSKFSLPTEVQWAFACANRGRKQSFPWGQKQDRPLANCGGCDTGKIRGRTAPVGSFPPNALGLYDMGGNVREWCRNPGRGSSREEPVRGGSFVDNVSRSTCRSGDRMISRLKAYYLGFRLVLKQR